MMTNRVYNTCMNKTLSHRTFNTLDLYNHALVNCDLRDYVFADDDDTDETNLLQYCDSMTPALASYYDALSLFAYDADAHTVTFDMSPPALACIAAMCALITFEYDADTKNRDDKKMWVLFDLSGDDDVDYNASYVTMLLDIVQSYAAAHPL